MARGDVGGVERTISLALTPEAKVGDYVLMHTGFAISVLDPKEAEETLQLLGELVQFYADQADEDATEPLGQQTPDAQTNEVR